MDREFNVSFSAKAPEKNEIVDGLEATRRIRSLGLTLPIIGTSAGAMEDEQRAARDAGMTDYVLKPIVIEALASALTRALAAPLALE